MKVYAVKQHTDYEGYDIVGVYFSLSVARERLEEVLVDSHYWPDEYTIDSYDVEDKPLEDSDIGTVLEEWRRPR